jgi:hypothetical protein
MSAATTDSSLLPLPISYTYPFPNNMRGLPLADRSIYNSGETLAVHHWDASWQTPSSSSSSQPKQSVAPLLTATSLIDMITRSAAITPAVTPSSSSDTKATLSPTPSSPVAALAPSTASTTSTPAKTPAKVDQTAFARNALLGKIAGFL